MDDIKEATDKMQDEICKEMNILPVDLEMGRKLVPKLVTKLLVDSDYSTGDLIKEVAAMEEMSVTMRIMVATLSLQESRDLKAAQDLIRTMKRR